jgi:hypothetical protein
MGRMLQRLLVGESLNSRLPLSICRKGHRVTRGVTRAAAGELFSLRAPDHRAMPQTHPRGGKLVGSHFSQICEKWPLPNSGGTLFRKALGDHGTKIVPLSG